MPFLLLDIHGLIDKAAREHGMNKALTADLWTGVEAALAQVPPGWGITLTMEAAGSCAVIRSPDWDCTSWTAGDRTTHDETGTSAVGHGTTGAEAITDALSRLPAQAR